MLSKGTKVYLVLNGYHKGEMILANVVAHCEKKQRIISAVALINSAVNECCEIGSHQVQKE